MENKNGVTISSKKLVGHALVDNATCWCGDGLIVAPKIFGQDSSDKLLIVCVDFCHADFIFDELVIGQQPHPIRRG